MRMTHHGYEYSIILNTELTDQQLKSMTDTIHEKLWDYFREQFGHRIVHHSFTHKDFSTDGENTIRRFLFEVDVR